MCPDKTEKALIATLLALGGGLLCWLSTWPPAWPW
jgi:hypothetical protein